MTYVNNSALREQAESLGRIATSLEFIVEHIKTAQAANAAPVPKVRDELEGARLVAVNMALNGEDKAKVRRYVHVNFDVTLPEAADIVNNAFRNVGA